MIEIGKINKLKVIRKSDAGIFLDGGAMGEILLPAREKLKNCRVNNMVDVFLYLDSSDSVTATTKKPHGIVGQFAYLQVVAVSTVGAFLDWGLPKDLMVPFGEQMQKMKEDRYYIVYIYFDEISRRIAASSKLNKFLNKEPAVYKEGEEVPLLISFQTDMGYKAIVNNSHWGMLYNNEVFQELQRGQSLTGYIKKVRDDGKIDLTVHKPGYKKVDVLTKKIIDMLNREGGFIEVTDKSSPQLIQKMFGESKSTFKSAVGALYKKRLISIEKDGIKLRGDNGEN